MDPTQIGTHDRKKVIPQSRVEKFLLTAVSEWNNEALNTMFNEGLSSDLKNESEELASTTNQ